MKELDEFCDDLAIVLNLAIKDGHEQRQFFDHKGRKELIKQTDKFIEKWGPKEKCQEKE